MHASVVIGKTPLKSVSSSTVFTNTFFLLVNNQQGNFFFYLLFFFYFFIIRKIARVHASVVIGKTPLKSVSIVRQFLQTLFFIFLLVNNQQGNFFLFLIFFLFIFFYKKIFPCWLLTNKKNVRTKESSIPSIEKHFSVDKT